MIRTDTKECITIAMTRDEADILIDIFDKYDILPSFVELLKKDSSCNQTDGSAT